MTNSAVGKSSDGLWTFFILTYALTLLTWGVLAIFQMRVAAATATDAAPSAVAVILWLSGGFTPTVAGVMMTWRKQGRTGLRDLGKRFTQFKLGFTWYCVIIGIPLVVQIVRAAVFSLRGGDFVRPEILAEPANLVAIIIFAFIVGSLSEEFGWRGFAQDRVLARWGAGKGSLILGLAWAFWHLILYFIPGTNQQQGGNPLISFSTFALQVLSMTLIFTWIHNNTNRSLWGAIFFHFVINYSDGFFAAVAEGAGAAEHLAGVVSWIVLAGSVFAFTRSQRQSEREGHHPEQVVQQSISTD